MRLKDKVAIVTGAGAGIGAAAARKFAVEGATVLVADVHEDTARDVVASIDRAGGKASSFVGDLSDEATAQACVQAAIDRYGRLDVLVSNAGVLIQAGEVDDCPVERFDDTMRINTRSTFLMTKFALPHLRKTRGNIVYSGSITAVVGAGEIAAYAGSKGFIHAFMMAVAMEQAKHGVRANVAAPGAIATAMIQVDKGSVISSETEQATSAGAAMGRQGTAEETANVIAFLASDEASYVTGAVFVVDGGVIPAQGAPGASVPKELRQPPPSKLPA